MSHYSMDDLVCLGHLVNDESDYGYIARLGSLKYYQKRGGLGGVPGQRGKAREYTESEAWEAALFWELHTRSGFTPGAIASLAPTVPWNEREFGIQTGYSRFVIDLDSLKAIVAAYRKPHRTSALVGVAA